jgi:hypothetical protein
MLGTSLPVTKSVIILYGFSGSATVNSFVGSGKSSFYWTALEKGSNDSSMFIKSRH